MHARRECSTLTSSRSRSFGRGRFGNDLNLRPAMKRIFRPHTCDQILPFNGVLEPSDVAVASLSSVYLAVSHRIGRDDEVEALLSSYRRALWCRTRTRVTYRRRHRHPTRENVNQELRGRMPVRARAYQFPRRPYHARPRRECDDPSLFRGQVRLVREVLGHDQGARAEALLP